VASTSPTRKRKHSIRPETPVQLAIGSTGEPKIDLTCYERLEESPASSPQQPRAKTQRETTDSDYIVHTLSDPITHVILTPQEPHSPRQPTIVLHTPGAPPAVLHLRFRENVCLIIREVAAISFRRDESSPGCSKESNSSLDRTETPTTGLPSFLPTKKQTDSQVTARDEPE